MTLLKKLIAAVLILSLSLSFFACGTKRGEAPVAPTSQTDVDPNAPLFDIQDETVFNQKVDELFAEMEQKSVFATDDMAAAYTKENARNLLLMWNIPSLSAQQLDELTVDDCKDAIKWSSTFFDLTLGKSNYAKYIADPSNNKIILNIDLLFNFYAERGQFFDTEEDDFIVDLESNYYKAIEENDPSFILWYFDICSVTALNKQYVSAFGHYLDNSKSLAAPSDLWETTMNAIEPTLQAAKEAK